MKAIITGSEGFIGKALAATLSKRGVDVIGIDRRIGIEAGEYFSNEDLKGVDYVFHLAAQTSVFNKNKSDIIRDNIEVFKIVCDACKRNNIKFIYASSSTANDENTKSLYGISKRFDEEYARCYNPQATGIRFHNVYSSAPRQGTLFWYLLNKDRIKLYNKGQNVRHFTYIDDIIESMIYAVGCDKPLINAANPEGMTVLKVANLVKYYKPLEIELVPEIRDFDCKEQIVNRSIYTVPLRYTPVTEGISRIFGDLRQESEG